LERSVLDDDGMVTVGDSAVSITPGLSALIDRTESTESTVADAWDWVTFGRILNCIGNGEVNEWDGDMMVSIGDPSQAKGDSGVVRLPAGLCTVANRDDEETADAIA
jgi:hypothetical protein